MPTVYVVTSGSYSAYGIEIIWSTKELAEEYLAKYPDGRIEEWDMDNPNAIGMMRGSCFMYCVQMNHDGTIRHIAKGDREYFDIDEEVRIVRNHKDHADVYFWMDKICKSEEHAVKIANDKRRQIIAEGNWKAGYKEG